MIKNHNPRRQPGCRIDETGRAGGTGTGTPGRGSPLVAAVLVRGALLIPVAAGPARALVMRRAAQAAVGHGGGAGGAARPPPLVDVVRRGPAGTGRRGRPGGIGVPAAADPRAAGGGQRTLLVALGPRVPIAGR